MSESPTTFERITFTYFTVSCTRGNISLELHIYDSRTNRYKWVTNSTWVGHQLHMSEPYSPTSQYPCTRSNLHVHESHTCRYKGVANFTWMSHELRTSASSSQVWYIHYTVPCTRGNVSHELHMHESQTCRDKPTAHEWVTNSTWAILFYSGHLLQTLLHTRFLCYLSKFPHTYVHTRSRLRTHARTHTQVSYEGRKQETKDMFALA